VLRKQLIAFVSPRSISSYDRIDDPMSNGGTIDMTSRYGVKMSCSEFQNVEVLYIFLGLPALPHVVARGILSWCNA